MVWFADKGKVSRENFSEANRNVPIRYVKRGWIRRLNVLENHVLIKTIPTEPNWPGLLVKVAISGRG